MPGAHKIGAAISGPRITGGNFMDTRLGLTYLLQRFLPWTTVLRIVKELTKETVSSQDLQSSERRKGAVVIRGSLKNRSSRGFHVFCGSSTYWNFQVFKRGLFSNLVSVVLMISGVKKEPPPFRNKPVIIIIIIIIILAVGRGSGPILPF